MEESILQYMQTSKSTPTFQFEKVSLLLFICYFGYNRYFYRNNLSNQSIKDGDTDNYAALAKHWQVNLQSIFLKYFLVLAKHMIQEVIIFPNSVLNIFLFRNAFFFINCHWIKRLDLKLKKIETFSAFKKSLLKFMRHSSNSISIYHRAGRVKLITRNTRIGWALVTNLGTISRILLNHDIKNIIDYHLLHYSNYLDKRRTLLENLQNIGENIHYKCDFQISELLLFSVSSNNDASDT